MMLYLCFAYIEIINVLLLNIKFFNTRHQCHVAYKVLVVDCSFKKPMKLSYSHEYDTKSVEVIRNSSSTVQ